MVKRRSGEVQGTSQRKKSIGKFLEFSVKLVKPGLNLIDEALVFLIAEGRWHLCDISRGGC